MGYRPIPNEQPPNYSSAAPLRNKFGITAGTIPRPELGRLQCVEWIGEFLVDKCDQPRRKAEKTAKEFGESGIVMSSLSRTEWETLIGPGGHSLFLGIGESRKGNGYPKARVNNSSLGLGSSPADKHIDASSCSAVNDLSVSEQIESLKEEEKELQDGAVEETWEVDTAFRDQQDAYNQYSSTMKYREEKAWNLKMKTWESLSSQQSRRRLRLERIRLDIIALKKEFGQKTWILERF